jgi:hypothetical protein
MTDKEARVAPLDGFLQFIRKNPEIYFGATDINAGCLAWRLATDLCTRSSHKAETDSSEAANGRSSILTVRSGTTWGVAADFDWLGTQQEEILKVFHVAQPFPEAGGNAIRAEPMVTAFATNVAVLTPGRTEPLVIKGVASHLESGVAMLSTTPFWQRAVVFDMSARIRRQFTS